MQYGSMLISLTRRLAVFGKAVTGHPGGSRFKTDSSVPDRAFNRNLTASFFAPFGLGLTLLALIVLWGIDNQFSITGWVEHSDQVMQRATDAQVELRDMQAAYRGYLVNPTAQYQSDLGDARNKFAKDLNELAALVSDNPDQEQILGRVTDLKEAWMGTVERLVAQRDRGAVDADEISRIQPQAQAVFSALQDFLDAERQLRTQRAEHQKSAYRTLLAIVPLFSILAMIVLSYWGWHQIQIATEQFNDALESAERARADAERATERAEKASRTKNTFLGTVSHELRNPLNSILLWSTALLRDKSLTDPVRRGVTAIERAVRVQGQLIEDLLDISRIESGRLRLDVQTVDLAEVVKAGVESMRAAADAKAITLREILDPRVDGVAGDPGRLQQIVWNLVSNAVKFTPRGGKIQVRLERINSHVEIIVADTGQGIEPASLGSVFDRFWQGAESGQSKQGVGLGLSIVKELVALHGGTVTANSDGIGKGSTFVVRLPMPVSKTGSLEGRRHPTVTQGASAAGAPRLDGFSILIVDDDLDTCDALKNLLGALGAEVTAATSVRSALSILDSMSPDAVVSDIGMPGEDGYFFARELRKRERDTGKDVATPLVALTAYGRVEDKVQILNAGFDSHAVKPVDPVELSAILRTCIVTRRGIPATS
jgi:signal transduction histidine kinase/ActR/RegA family two-component response regulator